MGYISGAIKASVVVGILNSEQRFHPHWEVIDLDLYVLDNLIADILIGQDTIDTLDIFNLHNESFIEESDVNIARHISNINIIRHIGSMERGVARLHKIIRKIIKSRFGSNPLGASGKS